MRAPFSGLRESLCKTNNGLVLPTIEKRAFIR